MDEWLKEHGTPALQRAHREGYAVKKGVADKLIEDLTGSVSMPVFTQWDAVGERTSPRAEAFGKRDLIVAVASSIPLPAGWILEVSKISRITQRPAHRSIGEVSGIDEQHQTGVLVTVRDECRKHLREVALSFE